MDSRILPLAVTMVAGTPLVSAIILVTGDRAVPVSLAFLGGVAVAVAAGMVVTYGLAAAFGGAVHLGDVADEGSVGNVVKYLLVGVLVLLAVRNWRGRRTSEPPRWLGSLMRAGPWQAFRTGVLVILLMPADLVVMLTVTLHLRQGHRGLVDTLPFVGLTVLFAALPLCALLLAHRRAAEIMPRVRVWMNTHSWLVNIAVCGLFVALIVAG